MIFYRLTDGQARQATTAIVAGLPLIAFMVSRLADEGREGMAIGFASALLVAFAFIGVQIAQSRRLNSIEREDVDG